MLRERKTLWSVSAGLICALFCGAVVISSVSADDQPQWGQRYSRNMVSGETGLPETFDPATGKNIKWVVPLGTQTYSTPVVAGGKVYIGTRRGDFWVLAASRNKRVIGSIDLDSPMHSTPVAANPHFSQFH